MLNFFRDFFDSLQYLLEKFSPTSYMILVSFFIGLVLGIVNFCKRKSLDSVGESLVIHGIVVVIGIVLGILLPFILDILRIIYDIVITIIYIILTILSF